MRVRMSDRSELLDLFRSCRINGTMMRREISRRVKPEYISGGEYGLLGAVRILGPRPLSILAKRLLKLNSNITYILEGLISKGYAEKVRSKDDRRSFNVSLTPEGEELADRMIAGRDRMASAYLSDLTKADKEYMRRIVLKTKCRIDSLEEVRPENMDPEDIVKMRPLRTTELQESYELKL